MASGKPRQRAWKPKNRTGCKTCKIRKVKCDEEKPHCKRCTSTGRKCDGYDANFRPAFHTPSPSPPSSHADYELFRSRSPVLLAPVMRFNSTLEQSSFEFFTTYAVPSLQGFQNSPFWQREILQAAHQHESIQHCIIALGAMNRRFFEGNDSRINKADMANQYLQFALQQSNRAIHGLLKEGRPGHGIAQLNKITLMTCSVLFSSMACLQGHQREGLQHLRSGIRLLHEIDRENKNEVERHPIDVESLRSILTGLDLQARTIMTTAEAQQWEPILQHKELTILQNTEIDNAALIATQAYLEALIDHALAFLQATVNLPSDEIEAVFHEYQSLIKRFDQGTKVLEQFCGKTVCNANDFTQSLVALQLLHSQAEYFLKYPRSDLEAKFNFMLGSSRVHFDLAEHFARMLSLSEQLLQHRTSSTPIFTTTMGPLSALWLIASRAPSSCTYLRKRAVELMSSRPRREGFWDGILAGKMAEELLRLEKENTQAELGLSAISMDELIIPEDLRIVVVLLTYDEKDDRKARVQYRSVRDMTLDTPGSIQYLTW